MLMATGLGPDPLLEVGEEDLGKVEEGVGADRLSVLPDAPFASKSTQLGPSSPVYLRKILTADCKNSDCSFAFSVCQLYERDSVRVK